MTGTSRHCMSVAGAILSRLAAGVIFLVPGLLRAAEPTPPVMVTGATVAVSAWFGRDCDKALRAEINGAREEILVAIYSITQKSIYSALVAATRRGVKVSVKFDADQMRDSEAMKKAVGYMKDRGVECRSVRLKGDYAKMHHKFAVFDRKRVATGSYNYSNTATRHNYENLIVIHSAKVAESFAKEFERIKGSR